MTMKVNKRLRLTAWFVVALEFCFAVSSGQVLHAASAASAAANAAGTVFHVQGAALGFNSSLPPSSLATYKWVPGAQSVGEWLTTTNGTSLGQRLAAQPAIPVSNAAPAGA